MSWLTAAMIFFSLFPLIGHYLHITMQIIFFNYCETRISTFYVKDFDFDIFYLSIVEEVYTIKWTVRFEISQKS